MLFFLQRKVSRLASIANEEESTCICSDQESVSFDVEIQSREETVMSDDEAEIVDLMNRVELMKKERSVLWLREFKEWMDHTSENFVDGTNSVGEKLHNEKENNMKKKSSKRYIGENSRYVSDSVQASGDESSTNILESDNSFADMSSVLPANPYYSRFGWLGNTGDVSLVGMGRIDLKEEHLKSYSHDGISGVSLQANRVVENVMISPLSAIDDIAESHSSSACPASPPHYQEDILHRRHTLVEETLQLSAESYSVASSDSNTSCSDDDLCESIPEVDKSLNEKYQNKGVEGHSYSVDFEDKGYYDQRHEILYVRENGISYSFADQNSGMQRPPNLDQSGQLHCNDFPSVALGGEIAHPVNQEADYLEKRKSKRKLKKRVISLVGENNVVGKTEVLEKSNGNLKICGVDTENEQRKQISYRSEFQDVIYKEQMRTNAIVAPPINNARRFFGPTCSSQGNDDFVENYFNTNVADSSIHETCQRYFFCDCVLEPESKYRER